MIRPVDSFGRSAALEFSRSPLLERNAPPPVGGELSRNIIRNRLMGFTGFVTQDWVWWPRARNKLSFAGEFTETIYSSVANDLTLSASGPDNQGQSTHNETAGWAAVLNGYSLISAVTSSRTQTQLQVGLTYRNAVGTQKFVVQTVTLEGDSKDLRLQSDIFWNACAIDLATAIDRPPPRTSFPILYEVTRAANDDGSIRELARGLRQPPPSQAFIDSIIPFAGMTVSILAQVPNGFVIGPTLSSLELTFERQVRHFTTNGEAQFGTIDDPFDPAATFAVSCERGFTEDFESVTPPLLQTSRLANVPFGTPFPVYDDSTSIEKRIIPPNAASSLLTC